MNYVLNITVEGAIPKGVETARQAFMDSMKASLGSDAEIEKCFRAWDRKAISIWSGKKASKADTEDARKYLMAKTAAGYAAADRLPGAMFLDFDFYIDDPK
jgi:3-mercaptopyruvate sulfurtransferase SseA